jgi:hypothetical protein
MIEEKKLLKTLKSCKKFMKTENDAIGEGKQCKCNNEDTIFLTQASVNGNAHVAIHDDNYAYVAEAHGHNSELKFKRQKEKTRADLIREAANEKAKTWEEFDGCTKALVDFIEYLEAKEKLAEQKEEIPVDEDFGF